MKPEVNTKYGHEGEAQIDPVVPQGNTGESSRSRLSAGVENYLQAIYVLREEGLSTTPGQLTEYLRTLPAQEGLGTSFPSVTGMIRRLVRYGLVLLGPSKEIKLTSLGNALARDVVRRHRLAECLVVNLLGVDLVDAHREAHRLEHGISSELAEKLAVRLGNPKTSPFGHPVPGDGDGLDWSNDIALDKAEPGRTYEITWVPEHDEDLLSFLIDNKIILGCRVILSEAASYRGVVVIEVDGRDVALGYQVAGRIRVRPGAPTR